MSKTMPPYYPPRARWYAPVFRVIAAARWGIAMDRIRLPSTLTWPGLALSFLVPGLGFYLRGPRLLGRAAMAACVVLFLIFVACLGLSLGNFAFGLIISIHATSIVYYCGPELKEWTLRNRVLLTVLILISIGALYYGPLRDLIQNRFLMPLQFNGRPLVVGKFSAAQTVRRGEWIAYHISYSYDYGDDAWIHIHKGMGLGPVLAVAGDTVEFSAKSFSVNGARQPPLPFMPSSGSLVVSSNHWFIWPNYGVSGHGYGGRISSIMLGLANVSERQYAGRPFKQWLWRKQTLP
ncbi:MAG: hypothetical protein ACREE6_01470 [Limisphaerales bacterium]